MRILIVNVQVTGTSTAKISYGYAKRLCEAGHQVILAYGMGKDPEDYPSFLEKLQGDGSLRLIKIAPKIEPMIHFRVNLLTGYHGRFGPIATARLKNIVKEFAPDVVQLYNLHGYYMNLFSFMDFLGKQNIPTVYGMLDEYPYMGYCAYAYDCAGFCDGCKNCKLDFADRYMKSLFFNRARKTLLLKQKNYDSFKKLVFTGPKWVLERAEKSTLLKGRSLREVDEYIDTEHTFVPRPEEAKELRRQLDISEEQVVYLDVAPSGDSRKGVRFFLELARRLEKDPRFVFVNVGFSGVVAGDDHDSVGASGQILAEDEFPSNFRAVSFVSDQKLLAAYYSMADVFLCTSLSDTMPNTCLDALACGTPILGFDISGVPYVAEAPVGTFVPPGDVDALLSQVLRTEGIRTQDALRQKCREYALKRYSPQVYDARLGEIYEEMKSERIP